MSLYVLTVVFALNCVGLSTDNSSHQALLDKLQLLEKTVCSLQASLQQQNIEITSLKGQLESLNTKCCNVSEATTLNKNSTEIHGRINRTNDLPPFLSKRMLQSPSLRESIRQQEVGFTAVKHNPLAVSEGATILFETTLTNIGSGYNPTKGVFTAPVDGMYVFSYNVECAKTNGDTYTELVYNGARLNMQAYCHGFGDSDNSGTMGILRLHAGDTVWIRLFDSDNRSFGWRTTFSGFLL